MKCFEVHCKNKVSCDKKECKMWIEYEEDLNCTLIAIKKNKGHPMTLREVGKRLDISFVRVKQIEDEVKKKIKKRIRE